MSIFENFELVNNQIVNNKWIEWYHFGIPNELDEWRKLAIISFSIFGHCRICTNLDGCYFIERNMPPLPLHNKCDCKKLNKNINEVKSNIHAECDIRKFTEYIFSDNSGKKRIFESWGYTIKDSSILKKEIESQAEKQYSMGNYKLKGLDRQGQRIAIEINLKGNIFYSGWMVYPNGLIKNTTPFGGWIK